MDWLGQQQSIEAKNMDMVQVALASACGGWYVRDRACGN
jgi:hypothetical protein